MRPRPKIHREPELADPTSARRVELFDLPFWAVGLEKASACVLEAIRDGRKLFIVTPNVDHIVLMNSDPDMKRIYQKSDFVFVDGMPIVWFSRLLPEKRQLPCRINGTNLMVRLCQDAEKEGSSIALLGGMPGAAEAASAALRAAFPGLKIAGFYCPPFGFESDPAENRKILELVEAWHPELLFIGVGSPKQEKWAAKNWDELNVRAAVGVGSAFDFISGFRRRAPAWIQRSGLEWFWRLLAEPGRLWKRYLVRDLKFIDLAWREFRSSRRRSPAF